MVDAIDGLTVEKAIIYLETLNPEHRLDCYLDGDTHGCDIVSRLLYEVPMTNQEIYDFLEKKYLKDIKMYEEVVLMTDRNYYPADSRQQRIDGYNRQIETYRNRIEIAKEKYLNQKVTSNE